MLGMTVFLLGNNMTALYDHVLKMISNGLGKCIAFLDRCQQHSKKSNSSCDTHKAFSEDDLNTAICHCYQITSDCQAVFFKIKNQLKADTKNKALVSVLCSIAVIIAPEEPNVWQSIDDFIWHKNDNMALLDDTLDFHKRVSDWFDYCLKKYDDCPMLGITTGTKYSRDMDMEMTYMTDINYSTMVAQINELCQKRGGVSLKTAHKKTDAVVKQPFLSLGVEIAEMPFEILKKDSDKKQYLGMALVQIVASEEHDWTDYLCVLSFDQALRLKSLFDIYHLSDKLHVWRGLKEWPQYSLLTHSTPMFAQVNEELDDVRIKLNRAVKATEFKIEKNRSNFQAQLRDAFEFLEYVFELHYRQDAYRIQNMFEAILKRARTSKTPLPFDDFVVAIFNEATLCADDLKKCEEAIFDKMAKKNADFSLKYRKSNGMSDGDLFMAQFESTLAHYHALIPPERYAQNRLYHVGVLTDNKNKLLRVDEINKIILNLLYDRGSLVMEVPVLDAHSSLEDCFATWSSLLPETLNLLVFEQFVGCEDKKYFVIVSNMYAQQIYALFSKYQISHKMLLFSKGMRRMPEA